MEAINKYIIFHLADEEFAVSVEQVQSIERVSKITTVPQSAHFMKGIIDLRGKVTPIIDLKERLEVGEAEYTEQTRILIINMKDTQIGLIVDRATDVLDIEADSIDSPPAMMAGINRENMLGVAKLKNRLIILLDLLKVLSLEEVEEVQNAIHSN